MPAERDARGPVQVAGLRCRAFLPMPGLHPTLPSQAPVRLQLQHPVPGRACPLTLHEWRPDGGAYGGLPEDLADAARRRAERVTLEPLEAEVAAPRATAPHPGLTPYALDLRWPA